MARKLARRRRQTIGSRSPAPHESGHEGHGPRRHPRWSEDPDGDLLSNQGEQRFGTNPRKADTNNNGRDDWHEDRDRDGRANGLEQDAGSCAGSCDHP